MCEVGKYPAFCQQDVNIEMIIDLTAFLELTAFRCLDQLETKQNGLDECD